VEKYCAKKQLRALMVYARNSGRCEEVLDATIRNAVHVDQDGDVRECAVKV
jgi:hypothetical protein